LILRQPPLPPLDNYESIAKRAASFTIHVPVSLFG
jgi:hypothetical protein